MQLTSTPSAAATNKLGLKVSYHPNNRRRQQMAQSTTFNRNGPLNSARQREIGW